MSIKCITSSNRLHQGEEINRKEETPPGLMSQPEIPGGPMISILSKKILQMILNAWNKWSQMPWKWHRDLDWIEIRANTNKMDEIMAQASILKRQKKSMRETDCNNLRAVMEASIHWLFQELFLQPTQPMNKCDLQWRTIQDSKKEGFRKRKTARIPMMEKTMMASWARPATRTTCSWWNSNTEIKFISPVAKWHTLRTKIQLRDTTITHLSFPVKWVHQIQANKRLKRNTEIIHCFDQMLSTRFHPKTIK